MKTPDYVLTEEINILDERWNKIPIPSGTFMRPIDFRYVPKHVIDNPLHRWFNKDTEVFCYCYMGIVIVDISKIREV